jgi:hypothetical protein
MECTVCKFYLVKNGDVCKVCIDKEKPICTRRRCNNPKPKGQVACTECEKKVEELLTLQELK